MYSTSNESILKLLRYLLVGGTTFFIQVAVSSHLILVFESTALFAFAVSNMTSLWFHYVANRAFTFSSTARYSGAIFRYIAVAALNYGIQVLTFQFVSQVLEWHVVTSSGFASLVTSLIGFILLKNWVFSSHRQANA